MEIIEKTKEYLKNTKNRGVLIITLIFLTLIIVFISLFYSKPLTVVPIGKLEKPRVCFNAVPLDENNIIFLGGYNKDEIFNTAEIYNLKTQKTTEIFKSNFNNKYGNLLVLSKNDKDENILINIQPIQFDENSKYGVEVYNIKTKKLERINVPITKRKLNEDFRYSVGYTDVNILDDTEFAEEILYKKYGGIKELIYSKKNYGIKNFGICDGMIFGGNKNENPNNNFKPFYSVDNLEGKLKNSVQNPEVYELKSSYWKDKCSEYLVVDKNNKQAPIQSILPYYPVVQILGLPIQVKGAELKDILPIDDWNILFVFEKNNTKYFVWHTNNKINMELDYRGKIKTEYKNQKYIYFDNNSYEILQIGGIKSKKPFNCGDEISTDIKINGLINKFAK